MSLGAAIGMAVGILAGMFALLFILAAVEEGMLSSVMIDPVSEDEPVLAEVEPLGQAA